MKRTEIVSVFQKKAFGLALTIGAASFIMAQQKVNISGNVKDANGAIGYASVTFKNQQNSQLSDAALADADGNYKLDLAPGSYDVTIEAVDYKKFNQTIRVEKAGPIAPFVIVSNGNANLNNTTDIQGVVITAASTKPYKVELDKKTYDVKSDLTAVGGNLQDVLQNVPSVSVDTDGTVSMRGSSNVRFLINGKPSALLGIDDGANALQAIPADQIDRIEVITNPSAKYDASGTAGILNIILKKTTKLGFNGSVIGTLGYLPKTNLNTNLSWKKGNWSWFLNGGGGYQEGKNTSRNNIAYTGGNIANSTQNSETNSKSENYNAMAGVTYDISPKTSINLSGNIRTFSNDTDNPIDYYDFNRNGSVDFTTRNSIGRMTNTGMQGDFGIDHKLDDKGQNISGSVSLQSNRSNNSNDITQITNSTLDYYNFTRQETKNRSLVVKLDYELPIGENSTFNAGYKLDDNQNDYDNLVLQQNDVDTPAFELPTFTGISKYNETFNAGYVQFKSKLGPIGYQVGLRNEHSKIEFSYPDTITGNIVAKNKDYNNLFPSVFLSYDFAKNNQLLVNYSRRIDRPRSWFLIPFFSFNNSRNLFSGNPDLNPSYIDSFEFGYNYSKSKLTINPTLYYRKEKDNVQMAVIQSTTDPSAFNIKPFNVGNEDRYGLDLNGTYDPFAWWKIMGNIDVFGYNTKGDLYIDNKFIQSYNGDGVSTRMRLSNTFKFDKTLSVQIQANFRGGQKNASQDTKSIYFFNLGATKTIWKGDGTLAFNIQDIFNTRARKSTTYGPDFQNEMYMQWQPRQMSLSLTYRFKQGEKVEQPKRKQDINSNSNGGDDMPPM
ncbi:TonB-dependent receptor domain-containing protein [Epilithonimonas lactis]|uniref:TonB-dependent receptor n=1 Tax=Epilithonimonas lactis TaxID=421072 RepID=A0A085BEY4_9FLAO|nr:TonB-dependent receptor [Epilithonimonas lactis]KFC21029.1 TonB-dependent receptor [Epilithonimonas lactis]SEP70440.1 Outer membrane receptor proteins, mostly Fe transport [Epilithonimonas lactis]